MSCLCAQEGDVDIFLPFVGFIVKGWPGQFLFAAQHMPHYMKSQSLKAGERFEAPFGFAMPTITASASQ